MISPSFSLFFTFVKNKKQAIGTSLLLSILQTGTLLPISLLIQNIFDNALPQKNFPLLVASLGVIAFLFCLNAAVVLGNRELTLRHIKKAIYEIRGQAIRCVIRKRKGWHNHIEMGVVQTTIVQDSERVDWMASAVMTQFLPGIFITLGLSIVLLSKSLPLFLVVAVVIPLLYGVGRWLSHHVRLQTRQFHTDFSAFNDNVLFTLKFHELIQLSTAEETEQERQAMTLQKVRSSSKRMALLGTAYTVIQSNLLLIAGVVVLFVGGIQVMRNAMSVGSLLSFYVALSLLSTNAKTALAAIPILIEGQEAWKKLIPFLTPEDLQEKQTDFPGIKTTIAFEQVSFNHSSSPPILRDVTLIIPKDKQFGIFGASGSGKSTLINLLLGFYEPQQGRITIDGRSLQEFDLTSYRRRIGVVPQDPQFFDGTIRENLTYGLPNATDAEIERVTSLCLIHEHISHLEQEYETKIGDQGAKLSGGQKQRLALARALLRNPELLILDEPDNNLDEVLFLTLLQNLKSLSLTMVIISHNRAIIPHLDGIYELS